MTDLKSVHGSPAAAEGHWAAMMSAMRDAREAEEELRSSSSDLAAKLAAAGARADAAAADADTLRAQAAQLERDKQHAEAEALAAQDEVAVLTARLAQRERAQLEALRRAAAADDEGAAADEACEALRSRLSSKELQHSKVASALIDERAARAADQAESHWLRVALADAVADGERRAVANEALRGKVAEREARLPPDLPRPARYLAR